MSNGDCVFCDLSNLRGAEVYIENDHCVYASTRDPRDPADVLPGCGIIVPIAHRHSPFEFTADEWAATHELLRQAKQAQDEVGDQGAGEPPTQPASARERASAALRISLGADR